MNSGQNCRNGPYDSNSVGYATFIYLQLFVDMAKLSAYMVVPDPARKARVGTRISRAEALARQDAAFLKRDMSPSQSADMSAQSK
jgi:hypothetical protein